MQNSTQALASAVNGPDAENAPADLDLTVDQAAVAASARIAPLWPLKHFVAVNPLLGLASQGLGEAGRSMARAAGARLTMPRSYYARLLAEERIEDQDLELAITELAGEMPLGTTPDTIRAEALRAAPDHAQFQLPTFATLAEQATGITWEAFLVNNISNWASDYFDQGVAVWSARGEARDPWVSYRQRASIDRSAELLGLNGARAIFAGLPADAFSLLQQVPQTLGVAPELLSDYFHRLLCDVAGWAGYARYRGWTRELRGENGSAARQLLAIRAAWELTLFQSLGDKRLKRDWQISLAQYAQEDQTQWYGTRGADQVMQLAFERAEQRRMAAQILEAQNTASDTEESRPQLQAAFCIDVRSERFRRALESVSPQAETIGFAGFFGLPIGYEDETGQSARCPVLLEPSHYAVDGGDSIASEKLLTSSVKRALSSRWSRFQRAAVAAFGYVEALGVTYLPKLYQAIKGDEHRCSHSASELKPTVALDLTEKVDMAEGLLRGMSLTRNFAPLVLFVGHGSTSSNNPYASALDCGACGGHAGDINARLAAELLNDRYVRGRLNARSIAIPEDTLFVAGLHDTTTDEVTLFDLEGVPSSDATQLEKLAEQLDQAGRLVRQERAMSMANSGADLDEAAATRAGDWSEVRPEWGLAGCRAFIAAPRERTRQLSLEGRSFLHNYSADSDPQFKVLETILTAPLVVASWITLQYYGSTVDNRRFGSGDKTLHNVVGGIGVLEGVGGDLRSGLPMQSLHNGTEFVHEPLRLTAIIEAPRAAVNDIISRHESLRELVDNEWIQLHVLDKRGQLWRRRPGGAEWAAVADHAADAERTQAA